MIILENSIGYVMDVDASKVIEAIRSDGVQPTQAMMHYTHYICSNLKSIGVWDKIKALYGFVGGTAATHKWNWKDMRDLDAAFRLSWNGGVTHSNLGIKGNGGITTFAETFILPSSAITLNSVHLSCYVSNELTSTGMFLGTEEGGGTLRLAGRYTDKIFFEQNDTNDTGVSYSGKTHGFWLSSRTSSNNKFVYNVNSNFIDQTKQSNSLANTRTIRLLGNNNSGASTISYPSLCQFGFFSIGGGLTQQQAIQMSNIITFAQGILLRQ